MVQYSPSWQQHPFLYIKKQKYKLHGQAWFPAWAFALPHAAPTCQRTEGKRERQDTQRLAASHWSPCPHAAPTCQRTEGKKERQDTQRLAASHWGSLPSCSLCSVNHCYWLTKPGKKPNGAAPPPQWLAAKCSSALSFPKLLGSADLQKQTT